MLIDETESLSIFGKLPNGWKAMHADDVSIKISKGTTPPKQDISNSGHIPFLRVNNLAFHGRLNKDSDFIFVSKEAHENFLARSKAYPGDVLMNIVGPPLGKIAILDDSFSQYNMNQAIVFYRLDKTKVDAEFFLSYLKSHYAQSWLISRSKKTSGQQNLTIELCKELPVPLPPLSEQKKIAQILSTWDKAITFTEKLLENSQKQKQALVQQLLTGKKRFLEFNGVWEQKRISELCKIGAGQSAPQDEKYFTNGTHDFLRVSDIGAWPYKHAPLSKDKINDIAVKELNLQKVAKGSTLFTKSGASLLLNQRVLLEKDTFIVSHLGYAKPNDGVESEFLYYQICNIDFNGLATGTSLPALQLSALSKIKVNVPIIQEQKKISGALSLADKEIQLLRGKLNLLKIEKSALMQQLLTGKKRVKLEG